MKKLFTILIIAVLATSNLFAQINNIVINEVMVNPNGPQGIVGVNGPTGWYYGTEYVEIYNTSCSKSIDISGWLLGTNTIMFGTSPDCSRAAGTICFPAGTILGPLQHLVIGTKNSSSDTSSIDIKLENYVPKSQINNTADCNTWLKYDNITFPYEYNGSNNSRPVFFLLPNYDGWLALYNSEGVVQDAIYWPSSQNDIISDQDSYDQNPQVPNSSGFTGTLQSAKQIYQSNPSKISWMGKNPSKGKAFMRQYDGDSVWVEGIASVNHVALATGNCNASQCNDLCYNINGYVYNDINENGIKDSLEQGLGNQKILILPININIFTDENGYYSLPGEIGDFQFKLFINNNWEYTTDSVLTISNIDSLTSSNINFGIKAKNADTNLYITLTSLDGGKCNSYVPYFINYKNIGNTAIDAKIVLNIDDKLKNISYFSVTPDSISIDSSYISWDIDSLNANTENAIKLLVKTPDINSSNDTLTSNVKILCNSDIKYSDTLKQIINCESVSNDKQVSPEGVYEEKFVLMNETLNYTIRFQNTGNDTAYHVIVIDTLDSSLDLNTFEVLSSSHNLQTSYNTNGIIEFRFDSIMLVDSTTNQPESQGFVKYKIKAKSGLEDNTVVHNTANIYFDNNPRISTNTIYNTLTYDISNLNIKQKYKISNKVNFYPNPFSQTAKLEFENKNNETYQLQITDITGKLLQTQQSNRNIMIIEKGNMPSGMYFYKLQNALTKESYNGKFVVE